MTDNILCWHFAADTLRDGSPLPGPGVTLPLIEDPQPCVRGYHGSERPIDALKYAPGHMIARVLLHGATVPHGRPVDKYAASLRTQVTAYVDAQETLRTFARWCALQVIDLWGAPDVVRRYLETGDKGTRNAVWDAARAAARVAARGSVRAAARDAALATWAAAGDAALDVAWAAARAAARAAAWDAARDAALDVAWNAALDAALDAQNTELERLLTAFETNNPSG